MLAMPSILRAQDKSLKVGVYGGYFKKSFDKNIFPDFTKATGIAVESVAEPTGEAWLVQLEQAAKAGQAPADVSMMSQTSTLKGQSTELWTPLDAAKIKNFGDLLDALRQQISGWPRRRHRRRGLVHHAGDQHRRLSRTAPTSWAALWDPANADKLGLLALVSNSFLLEVTAKTFFGGTNALDTEEGSNKAFAKLAEVKPNVRLWYRDEAQFEQALKSGEIPMGQYYHDVTGLAAADGHPVRSTFPKEGGIQDSGNWVLSRASHKVDEAHVFIDYMSQPSIQGLMSRKVGTAPTLKSELLDLTRGRVRRRVVRHRADHPALRPLQDEGRLAEPEVDRTDRRLSSPPSPLRRADRPPYRRRPREKQCTVMRLPTPPSGRGFDGERAAHLPGSAAAQSLRGMSMSGLAINSVTKEFGNFKAVDNVELDVPHGKFVCLLGPSGCGKTTLLRMIAGLEQPTTGAILLDGEDITRVPTHKRNLGMVFQSLALFPHLTVGENIAYALRIRGASKEEQKKRVDELLKLVHLPGFADRPVAKLSGGQRQRVAIARALALSPKLFLLDEPLSALDAKLREAMQVELRQLQQRLGITTIVVTHDQREAMTMADLVVVMDDGQIRQAASPIEIYRKPGRRLRRRLHRLDQPARGRGRQRRPRHRARPAIPGPVDAGGLSQGVGLDPARGRASRQPGRPARSPARSPSCATSAAPSRPSSMPAAPASSRSTTPRERPDVAVGDKVGVVLPPEAAWC